MNKRICLSAVLLVLPLTTAVAQQQPLSLEPGARVRITAPYLGIKKQAATFQALRGDTLVVMADSTMRCPLAAVTRLDVYRGRKSHPWRGAAVGAAVGGVGALAVTVAACSTEEFDCSNKSYPAAAVGVGILGGGLIGLGIGALTKTDRWEEVPVDQIRVSFVPRRDGFALGFSVAF